MKEANVELSELPFSSSSWPAWQEDAFDTDPDGLYGRASDRFCQLVTGSVEMD